jgi:hypothetical protein
MSSDQILLCFLVLSFPAPVRDFFCIDAAQVVAHERPELEEEKNSLVLQVSDAAFHFHF